MLACGDEDDDVDGHNGNGDDNDDDDANDCNDDDDGQYFSVLGEEWSETSESRELYLQHQSQHRKILRTWNRRRM